MTAADPPSDDDPVHVVGSAAESAPAGPATSTDPEELTADEPAVPALGRRVRRGLAFSLANTVVGRTGTFLAGLILARLLTPEDYGEFAVALVVLAGLLSINELGVSLAIIRWPGDPKRIAPTVTTIAILGSTALFVLTFLAAPVLAEMLGSPSVTWLIRALAVGVILDGITAVPAAGMTREFAQGRRMALDSVGFMVTISLTVGLALGGLGAWALVAGRLAGSVVSLILFLSFGTVRAWPGWDSSLARQLLAFGAPLAGTSLLVFAMANADLAVVGATLGPEALGFYLLASNLANWPVNVVSTTVRRVSFAGFSAASDADGGRSGAFVTSLPLLLSLVLPVCLGLSLLATPVIVVLYGQNWAPAGDALRFLALLAAARVVVDLCYDFLAADGKGKWTLGIQIGWLVLYLPTLMIASQTWGIGGAAAANAAVAWLAAVPAFLLAVTRRGASARRMAASVVHPLVGTTALFAVVLLVLLLVDSQLAVVLVAVPLGAAVYVGVMWPLLRAAVRGVRPPGS